MLCERHVRHMLNVHYRMLTKRTILKSRYNVRTGESV
jgi:hypothetical protein